MTCLYRGADFRPDYCSAVTLRSICPDVSFLGLSATVSPKVMDDVLRLLQLRRCDVHVDCILPDRPNIFLEVSYYSVNKNSSVDEIAERDFLRNALPVYHTFCGSITTKN